MNEVLNETHFWAQATIRNTQNSVDRLHTHTFQIPVGSWRCRMLKDTPDTDPLLAGRLTRLCFLSQPRLHCEGAKISRSKTIPKCLPWCSKASPGGLSSEVTQGAINSRCWAVACAPMADLCRFQCDDGISLCTARLFGRSRVFQCKEVNSAFQCMIGRRMCHSHNSHLKAYTLIHSCKLDTVTKSLCCNTICNSGAKSKFNGINLNTSLVSKGPKEGFLAGCRHGCCVDCAEASRQTFF